MSNEVDNKILATDITDRLYSYLLDHYNQQNVIVPTFIHQEIYREIKEGLDLKDGANGLRVSAEVHSDDYVMQVNFDATRWFEQAINPEIRDLHNDDWRGSYAADDVARYMSYTNKDIANLLDYVASIPQMGFEVVINEDEAMAWMKENKSTLAKSLTLSE